MFIYKKLLIILISLFTISLFCNDVYSYEYNTPAKQAYMIDVETGTVLYSKNATSHMPTSSMSKAMTAYVVFDALKNKQISLNDTFLISKKAWKKGGSKMFIEVGKRVKIEDLLHGLLTQSGNDASIALAEGVAITEEAFARMLNSTAKKLGMNNSNFKNASGWPDPDHYSTAEDLAILAKAIINNHPEYYQKFFSVKEFTFNEITQKNRNPLLFRDMNADGLKTGHTEIAGYGLIGSAIRDDRRVIMVINGLNSEKDRAEEGARLLEWGLAGFKNNKIIPKEDIIAELDTVFGKKSTIQVKTKEDIIISIPNTEINNLKTSISYNSPIIAPIKKNDKIAELIIKINGMDDIIMPLIAAEDIQEQGIFLKTISKIKLAIFGQ